LSVKDTGEMPTNSYEDILVQATELFAEQGELTNSTLKNIRANIYRYGWSKDSLRQAVIENVHLYPKSRHDAAMDYYFSPEKAPRKWGKDRLEEIAIEQFINNGNLTRSMMDAVSTNLYETVRQTYSGGLNSLKEQVLRQVSLYPQERHEAAMKKYWSKVYSFSRHLRLLRMMVRLNHMDERQGLEYLQGSSSDGEPRSKVFSRLYEDYWRNEYPGHTARLIARTLKAIYGDKLSDKKMADLGSGPLSVNRTLFEVLSATPLQMQLIHRRMS
jgi:hypothetical protein